MSCLSVLKNNGLRLTKPRKEILDYIHANGGHITAENIIKHVQKSLPKVNKSTIYRTLDLLESNSCLYKSEQNDRIIYHHADTGHHHHLSCSKCGGTIECEDVIFASLEEEILTKYKFKLDMKHTIIKGTCAQCASAQGK